MLKRLLASLPSSVSLPVPPITTPSMVPTSPVVTRFENRIRSLPPWVLMSPPRLAPTITRSLAEPPKSVSMLMNSPPSFPAAWSSVPRSERVTINVFPLLSPTRMSLPWSPSISPLSDPEFVNVNVSAD